MTGSGVEFTLGGSGGGSGGGVTSAVAGSGITVSGATGAVTFTNTWGTYPLTATGDILYANTAATNTRLPIGAAGTLLGIQAGIPSWTFPNHLSAGASGTNATLQIAQDGTLTTTATASVPTFTGLAAGITSVTLNAGSNASHGTFTIAFSGSALPATHTAWFTINYPTAYANPPTLLVQRCELPGDTFGSGAALLYAVSNSTGSSGIASNAAPAPTVGQTYTAAYWIIGS